MSTAIAEKPETEKRETKIVHDDGAASYLMDTARFEHCYRIASAIAQASLLPDHLTTYGKEKKPLSASAITGNCFRLVNQAIRWGMDPFALPDESYVVANKLGYQGKLVAAVINSRSGLRGGLQVIYNSGKGDDLAAVVFGSHSELPPEAWPLLKRYCATEDGEAYTDLLQLGVKCVRVTVGQAKTDNKMWRTDPQQKLWYTGATKWGRRHSPEILLGVMTEDDLERIKTVDVSVQDVTTNAPRIPKTLGDLIESDPSAPGETSNPANQKPADEPKPETTTKPVEKSTPTDRLAEYDRDMQACLKLTETTQVYDEWFGPQAEQVFTPEENLRAVEIRDARRDAIRAASKKQDATA